MLTPIKPSGKIITLLSIAYLFLPLPANPANALPTADDINRLAEAAKLTANTFMQQSFELRMRYEFSGNFLKKEERDNLYKLAKRASDHLQATAEQQKQLKQEIEDYQGDDWDSIYGSTGLWRKLSTDLYKTCLSKCEINFYLALASQQPQRDNILQKILSEIDSLNRDYKQPGPKLIKAKVLALLAQTNPIYRPLAIKELEAIPIYSNISRPIGAAIEKIKLVGSPKPAEFNTLIRTLTQNRYNGNLELILKLAFLQRRHDPNGFEKTISLFPQTEIFLGQLILSDLSTQLAQGQLTKESLQQISIFEAELAAETAWRDTAQNYKLLLEYLSSTEKFQTPLMLYVAAIALAESSPAKAINLLIVASKLQQEQKSNKLETPACKIAEQAAQLAYNLFISNSDNAQLALEAFNNYFTTANEKIDEELEYFYTIILNDCGQTQKSKELLKKIANRPTGNWRNRAKLELIIQQLQQNRFESRSQRNKLLKQLSDLIANCNGQEENHKQIRAQAITLYCQLLLESQDKASAQKVLNILGEAEITRDPNLNAFKSKTLRQLGRLDESTNCLLKAIDFNHCRYTSEAMELLAEIIDQIDQLQEKADNFAKLMKDCEKIAEFCYGCIKHYQTGLYLAEVSIFAADRKQEKLSAVDTLLNNLDKASRDNDLNLLRCRARLLAAQGNFEAAAKLWAQICQIRKSQTPSARKRSWKWWRAKFYELACWAKRPQTKKQNILHTIEVLENSFQDIPPLWAKKLNSLKQQYQNRPANICK